MVHEGWGFGILEQHCPISIFKPHPSRGHSQRGGGLVNQGEAEISKGAFKWREMTVK